MQTIQVNYPERPNEYVQVCLPVLGKKEDGLPVPNVKIEPIVSLIQLNTSDSINVYAPSPEVLLKLSQNMYTKLRITPLEGHPLYGQREIIYNLPLRVDLLKVQTISWKVKENNELVVVLNTTIRDEEVNLLESVPSMRKFRFHKGYRIQHCVFTEYEEFAYPKIGPDAAIIPTRCPNCHSRFTKKNKTFFCANNCKGVEIEK